MSQRQDSWRASEERASKGQHRGDKIFSGVAACSGALVVLVLALMAAEMMSKSGPSFQRFGLEFLVGNIWDPVGRVYGAFPFIYGTVVSSTLALLIAVPVSFGVAIFLSEFSPEWLRHPLSFLVELLAAVPSVVYGIWGIFALAPWMRSTVEPALASAFGFLPVFQGPHQGFGMLSGAVILAIMIVPTIASVSREVLRSVPHSLREAALALGATRWEAVSFGVLPVARAGLFGAVMLGLGRALGETMAIAMVIGNRPEISASLFAPAATMSSVIANEFAEATDELHLAALSEIGLLLLLLTMMLNVAARLLVRRATRAFAEAS